MRSTILLLVLASLQAGCDPEEGIPTLPADNATFQLGINTQELPPPGAFMSIVDGSTVPVVLGGQGAWMVVGALRTGDFKAGGKVTITALLEDYVDGTVYSTLKFRRSLQDGGDGYRYLHDVFMVVGQAGVYEERAWEGRRAVLTLGIEADGGEAAQDSSEVILQTQE